MEIIAGSSLGLIIGKGIKFHFRKKEGFITNIKT